MDVLYLPALQLAQASKIPLLYNKKIYMEQFLSSDCISMKTKKNDNTVFASIK